MHDDSYRGPGSKACLVPLTLLILLSYLSSAARAGGLIPCPGTSQAGYKVLLDDLSIHPPSANLSSQMDALRYRLDGELRELTQETAIKVVRCAGRTPGGQSDFSQDLLDLLRVKRVALEVWGSVSDGEALVSFLIIPVRPGEREAYGFHQVSYTIGKTSNPLDLFKERSELPVLGLLSMALYNLRQENGPGAYGLLTKAELRLKKGPNPAAGLVDYLRKLREEARQMACRSPNKNLACSAPRGGRP